MRLGVLAGRLVSYVESDPISALIFRILSSRLGAILVILLLAISAYFWLSLVAQGIERRTVTSP